MKLKLHRKYFKDSYTIGDLYIDDSWYCNTLEDTDRGLHSNMPLSEIKKIKVPNETAIPTGTYKIDMNTVSPRFGSKDFYKTVCDGKLPRLLNVPGFDGILIHVGEGVKGPDLTSGCILVGLNLIKGGLLWSKESFRKVYNKLKEAKEDIFITIEN